MDTHILPGNNEFDAAYFDEASKAWRANKRVKPGCIFVYTLNECTHIKKNGKRCTNTVSKLGGDKCKYHSCSSNN